LSVESCDFDCDGNDELIVESALNDIYFKPPKKKTCTSTNSSTGIVMPHCCTTSSTIFYQGAIFLPFWDFRREANGHMGSHLRVNIKQSLLHWES
jgi:hypothetical protein